MLVPNTLIVPAIAAVLCFSLATEAAAQLRRTLNNTGIPPEAMSAMQAAGATLLHEDGAQRGASAEWEDRPSRSSGTVEITSVSGNCAVLTHEVMLRNADAPRVMSTQRCRNAAGDWLLSTTPTN